MEMRNHVLRSSKQWACNGTWVERESVSKSRKYNIAEGGLFMKDILNKYLISPVSKA